MRLNHKVLLITGLIWIFFLLAISFVLYPVLTSTYFIVLFSACVLSYVAIYQSFKILIFNHLKKLKQTIKQQKFYNNFSIHETDELTALTIKINYLISILHTYEEKLSNYSLEENKKYKTPSLHETGNEVHDYLGKLAHYDILTTLPNHIFFNEILNKTLNRASRHNEILAILLIDVNLKNIHHAQKHKIINKILKEIVSRTSSVLRNSDILARSGNNEFIILLNDIKKAKLAGLIAEKILHAYSKPILIDEEKFYITANIGISTFPEDGLSLESLQKTADLAVYNAKTTDTNTYQYFTHDRTLEANAYTQLENDLQRAVKNAEFILHYQPQFNISTGKINGVEALIRWLNPKIGIVSPNSFIHYIEDNGLIIPIGEWIIHEACRANKSWQESGYPPIKVSVNLSPKQFEQNNIADIIQHALTETKLEPQYLELEITEMTVMSNISDTIQKLNQLKQLGVKICIDDFGTGYTSINHLKYFTIDILKIDQNFIKNIPDNPNDMAITTAIIGLAHNLGMKVVAEGVETTEQLQFLTEKNCDLIQGYYLSRPLPEEELLAQFKKIK